VTLFALVKRNFLSTTDKKLEQDTQSLIRSWNYAVGWHL